MTLLLDILEFLKERKKLWMLPIFILLIVLGGLIVLSQGSAIAPFLYPLF